MLQEKEVFEQTYNVNASITVKKYTIILKDDVIISRTNPHTKTLCPGDDYSNEDADTKKMCEALWTPDVIASYRASLSSE